jgi:hypothetical protein
VEQCRRECRVFNIEPIPIRLIAIAMRDELIIAIGIIGIGIGDHLLSDSIISMP